MLTVNDSSVIVPPIPTPRKNKLRIHGQFTMVDLLVVAPILVTAILIMVLVKMSIWYLILTFLIAVFISAVLVWPMGFLGKEKIYMYILRGIKFLFATHKHLQTENSQNVFDNQKNQTSIKERNEEKDQTKEKRKTEYIEKPKDTLTKIIDFFKKHKKSNPKKEKNK